MGDFNTIASYIEHKGAPFGIMPIRCIYSLILFLITPFWMLILSVPLFLGVMVKVDWPGGVLVWTYVQLIHNGQVFNSSSIMDLTKIAFDNSPLLLVVNNTNCCSCKIFGFENYQLEYADWLSVVHNSLNFQSHSSVVHNFAHILSCIRKSLLDRNTSYLGALDKVIKDTEMEP